MTTSDQLSQLSMIPVSMQNLRRWTGHRLKQKDNSKKLNKVPWLTSGKEPARSNAPKDWVSFDDACRAVANGKVDGISFVLAADDGLVCIDLDGVRDPESGEVTQEAAAIIAQCDSYTEVSQSGAGFHIFIKGSVPKASHKNGSWVEIYARDKIIAMTGDVHELYLTLEERDITSLFERAEAGEFTPATTPKAKVNGKDASAADFALACRLAKEFGGDEAKIRAKFLEQSKQNPAKLARKDYVDMTLKNALAAVQREKKAAAPITPVEIEAAHVPDMPPEVLDGWLGQVCRERMNRFPIAYAWPALLAAGSAVVPCSDGEMLNLYCANVGDIGSGKSQAFEYAKELLGVREPTLLELQSGSAEGLTKLIADVGGASRFVFIDEFKHLLTKAAIQGSTFTSFLCTAFYKHRMEQTQARGSQVKFDARLSFAGGVVEEEFGDLFGAATTGGLYDRFIFGLCPTDYSYKYRPFSGGPALVDSPEDMFQRPVSVKVADDVWNAKDALVEELQCSPRIGELAVRVARICAAFDGRPLLTAADLGPARTFAAYQAQVRKFLKPDTGKTVSGTVTTKILAHLRAKGPNGEWLNRRKLMQSIRAYDFGADVAIRVFRSLELAGEIEQLSQKRGTVLVRLTC